jgi:uncharacterized membrane protein
MALSDGVFAIILTLLVLEIRVPDLAEGQSLLDASREIRSSFIAFLISFVVVAIAWAGHRDLFSLIRNTDRLLVWLNIVYLLPLCVLPFGASLISRYDRDPVGLRMYGILLLAVALARLVIWLYATGRPHLLFAPIDGRSRRAGIVTVMIAAAIYVVAIGVAEEAPTLSLLLYAGAPALYFTGLFLGRSANPPQAADRGRLPG